MMGDQQWPREVARFETSDNRIFSLRESAECHQERIHGAARATEMLESGASLGAALRTHGFLLDGVLAELDEVYATTDLVIEHWQCRAQPGYRPIRVTSDGDVFVHGHAGSWSGSYGNTCTPKEVAMYWLDTNRRAEGRARNG